MLLLAFASILHSYNRQLVKSFRLLCINFALDYQTVLAKRLAGRGDDKVHLYFMDTVLVEAFLWQRVRGLGFIPGQNRALSILKSVLIILCGRIAFRVYS